MGNPCRRPAKKASIPLSSTSSSSGSGVSPKSLPKSSIAVQTGSTTNMNVKEQTATTATGSTEVGDESKPIPANLRFRSFGTGTLDTTAFQPAGYIPKQVQPVASPTELSAKSPDFVPAPPGKSNQKAVVTSSGTRQSYSTPQKKPQSSAAMSKLQHVLKEFPPYNAARHAKHLSDISSGQSSASAMSVGTSRTTTSPSPVKVRESIVRVDSKKKDFIICATGVSRNRFHVDELELFDGKLVYQPNTPFNPVNLLGEIAEKDEADKEHFWANHHVQIIIDLRNVPTAAVMGTVDTKGKGKEVISPHTVIDQIEKLGSDFFQYATRITVDLIFPPLHDTSSAARPYGPRAFSSKDRVDFVTVVNNKAFKLIEEVAAKLNNCEIMVFLEVILHNPNASTSLPFTVEQLLHTLPFYELRFEDWKLRWQANYMTTPAEVGHFPIILLDKERNKWLWAQRNAERQAGIAARKKQEIIDNAVFVRQSIAPEWQNIRLPQPFPPAAKSLSPKENVHGKKIL